MSEENVELVRRNIDAFNEFMARGDREEIRKTVAELADPQVEFHWHDERAMPDTPQHLRSAADGLRFFEQLRSAWIDLTLEPLEFIEAPGDRVLTHIRQSGRGRESGVPVVVHPFVVWTIRDGKLSKMELFRHRADALEAAGLSE